MLSSWPSMLWIMTGSEMTSSACSSTPKSVLPSRSHAAPSVTSSRFRSADAAPEGGASASASCCGGGSGSDGA